MGEGTGKEASVLCCSQVRALRIALSSCWTISLPPGASKHTEAAFFLQASPAWLRFMPCPGEAPHSVAFSLLDHVPVEETPLPIGALHSSSSRAHSMQRAISASRHSAATGNWRGRAQHRWAGRDLPHDRIPRSKHRQGCARRPQRPSCLPQALHARSLGAHRASPRPPTRREPPDTGGEQPHAARPDSTTHRRCYVTGAMLRPRGFSLGSHPPAPPSGACLTHPSLPREPGAGDTPAPRTGRRRGLRAAVYRLQ